MSGTRVTDSALRAVDGTEQIGVGGTGTPEHILSSGLLTYIGGAFTSLTGPTTLTAADSRTTYDNTGTAILVVVTLPVGAQGLEYEFNVTDADGIKLTADGVEEIAIGGSSAINMTCTQVGGSVKIRGITGGGWIASSAMRTWIDS
jgi:hypothetical protein